MKDNLLEFSLENIEVALVMLTLAKKEYDLVPQQLKTIKQFEKELWNIYSSIKNLQGKQILNSLSESQPEIFLTKLEQEGIEEDKTIDHLIGILRRHVSEYHVGSFISTLLHNEDNAQKDNYLVGQFLVFAILSIEACYKIIGSFEKAEEDIPETSESLKKKEFGIEKLLNNWGFSIKPLLEPWINNVGFPVMNKYCLKYIYK